eukprot:gene19627-biopygen2514
MPLRGWQQGCGASLNGGKIMNMRTKLPNMSKLLRPAGVYARIRRLALQQEVPLRPWRNGNRRGPDADRTRAW